MDDVKPELRGPLSSQALSVMRLALRLHGFWLGDVC
jgi:hypothetical protein